jgi:membrane-bound lytic murein transglycosylase B
MTKQILKIVLLFSLISVLIFPPPPILEKLVLPNEPLEKWRAFAQEECSTREECEALLKKYEEEIKNLEGVIGKTEQEKKTLQNQIYILKKKIEKLNLQIQESNVMIRDVSLQIKDTEASIEKTSLKIEESKNQLANILQLIYEEDQKSLLEILLSEKKLSDFFDKLMALETLNLKNQELLENIKNLKSYLEEQKQSLDEEKEDLERALKIQILQKQENETVKKEKDYFLKLTEAQYQKYLKEKEETERKAQAIRARIFELIGVPKAPTFGEAYEIAKYVEKITGVRPALLLAVLTQESNIGKNVGQCYLKNPSTGEGVRVYDGKSVSRVMNPKRDVPYFLEITQKLGRDPYHTPVSCPMSVGWGGAMGPAQFIPDTWANPRYGYSQKVSEITGKPADPWNIKDAFLAAGLYLRDLGAKQNEFRAVMQYFSGSSWSKWEEFYGRSVLNIASQYEEDIREIEKLTEFSKPLTLLEALF